MMVLIVMGVPIGFAMLTTAVVGYFIVGRPNFAETQLSITFFIKGRISFSWPYRFTS